MGLAALVAWPSTRADAALLNGSQCPATMLTQPFVQFGDANYYSLVAGGDFETAQSSWTLSGGAKRVLGSDPFGATGKLGAYSLSLPAGASAQSPFVCVNVAYPSFRLFALNEQVTSAVLVQAVYRTVLGTTTASLGTIALATKWQPSSPMLTNSIVGGVLSGGSGQVALRFTALLGPSRIDDVFIDPRMSH
jgi:hypothetical protein